MHWLGTGLPSIYRGQADASWDLRCSIERELRDIEKEEGYWITDEYYSIREFQRRAPLYRSGLPGSEDWVTWLALMQHHGAKTRLIDFTYSPYIAAYFAAIDARQDFAVWQIADIWIRDLATINVVGDPNHIREDALALQHDHANKSLSLIYRKHRGGSSKYMEVDPGLFFLEPAFLSSRQSIQQGMSLMVKNIHMDFATNLEQAIEQDSSFLSDSYTDGSKRQIYKTTFAYWLRQAMLTALNKMNITAENLFGGLDGLAASLAQRFVI